MLARLCVITALAVVVRGHSYHLGGCPTVEPVPEFEMSKFLGKWYVIQKTSTSSRCLTYNFTASSEPNEYDLEQVSEHPILGLASVDNKYHYTGHLTASPDTPAKMVVKFPLSVAGSASYTVFFTDYTTYGAVFTCQRLLNLGHRQSATILSRTKTLDKVYLDKIKGKLSAFGIDPYDLSRVDQSSCPGDNDHPKVDININDETFSPQSIAGVVRKAGEKIADGVDVVKEEAKKLYNAASSDGKEREELIHTLLQAGEKIGDGVEVVAEGAKKLYNSASSNGKDREELNEHQENAQVEWLP